MTKKYINKHLEFRFKMVFDDIKGRATIWDALKLRNMIVERKKKQLKGK